MNEITISKTTAFLAVGLIVMACIGAYLLFLRPAALPCLSGSDNTPCSATNGAATNQQPAYSGSNPNNAVQQVNGQANAQQQYQEVYLKATAYGYDKSEIDVKKGVPVRLHFTAINAGCGAYMMIYGMGVSALSKNGQEAVVEFTPDSEGTYEYNCGMRMFKPGRFVVTS